MQTFAHICASARRVCSPAVAQAPGASLMADRRLLTDRYLRRLATRHRKASASKCSTPAFPGFGLRITDAVDADPARRGKAGKISFILFTRFSPGAAPTRRVIGTYGAVSLEDARRTAGEWREPDRQGHRPGPSSRPRPVRRQTVRRALRIRHSFGNAARNRLLCVFRSVDAKCRCPVQPTAAEQNQYTSVDTSASTLRVYRGKPKCRRPLDSRRRPS